MNAFWRKSAAFSPRLSGPRRARAGWLILSFILAAGFGGALDGKIINASRIAGLACPETAHDLVDEVDTAPVVPTPRDNADFPTPLPAFARQTGLHIADEAERLIAGFVVAEERRVCAWQHISNRITRGALASLTWLAVLIMGWVAFALTGKRRETASSRESDTIDALYSGHVLEECFEQSSDGMILLRVEPNDHFIYHTVNSSWQRLFGQDAQSSVGRQPHDVWPSDFANAMVEKFRRCVASGDPIRFEEHSLATTQRDLAVVITPVRIPHAANGAAGPVAMLLCVAHDTTEQTQLAVQLQNEQRMETIRRLSAGVAHDFNNILQAICGGLELIVDEAGSAPIIRELASIAQVAAQRGSHLTQHLLAYARRQVLSPQPIDLREFLPRMRIALEQAIGPNNDLELAFCGDDATIFADELNLRTALLNLAFNAGRAMTEGGRLRIQTSVEATDHQTYVCISVSDTGAGMDSATLERCHEPFFTTKGATGTGLGLSMVQGFVAQSGGTLRLSSKPGQGTTAVLTLPVGRPASAPAAIHPTKNCIGRVLLVDDATDVLVTTGRMLQRAGLEVTPVQSGDAALTRLAAGEVFDILVTDYAMPGLSGVELIRLAREMQPGLPGLIITGFHEVDIGRLEETACVLRKPFQRQDLLSAIHERIRLSTLAQTE